LYTRSLIENMSTGI